MISRELAINLGITLVVSIGLFVYFNSKVNKVENKINAVFEIIQQHNSNNMEYMSPNEQQNMGEFMQINEVLEEKNNLVEISEDEESDDSEEESDDGEEESDDSEEESDDNNETEKVTKNEEGESKVSLIDLNIETVNTADDIEQVTIEPPSTINISELLAKKSDEQKKNEEVKDDLSDIGDFDDEEKPDKPLDKCTVQELKDYAAKKKLKKYKSLTKPKLIELIENAE